MRVLRRAGKQVMVQSASSDSSSLARRRSFGRPAARRIRIRPARSRHRITSPSQATASRHRARKPATGRSPHGRAGVQQSPLANAERNSTLGRPNAAGSHLGGGDRFRLGRGPGPATSFRRIPAPVALAPERAPGDLLPGRDHGRGSPRARYTARDGQVAAALCARCAAPAASRARRDRALMAAHPLAGGAAQDELVLTGRYHAGIMPPRQLYADG
jgi:hypothetical protein